MGVAVLTRDTLARLERSREFIDASFMKPLTLEDAAREAYFSPFYYHRLFSRAFGQTPHDFLTSRRVDLAKKLLADSDLTVTEICFELGYSSLGTFSSMFQKATGCSPTKYREGCARFYRFAGFSTHRFVPTCFLYSRGVLKPGAES
jgi:AraC-like DNA-binding protein